MCLSIVWRWLRDENVLFSQDVFKKKRGQDKKDYSSFTTLDSIQWTVTRLGGSRIKKRRLTRKYTLFAFLSPAMHKYRRKLLFVKFDICFSPKNTGSLIGPSADTCIKSNQAGKHNSIRGNINNFWPW